MCTPLTCRISLVYAEFEVEQRPPATMALICLDISLYRIGCASAAISLLLTSPVLTNCLLCRYWATWRCKCYSKKGAIAKRGGCEKKAGASTVLLKKFGGGGKAIKKGDTRSGSLDLCLHKNNAFYIFYVCCVGMG